MLEMAIPAIMSVVGSLFGKDKGKTVTAEQMMPEWQSETGKSLANWIQQYMGQYIPGAAYTGKRTAGATPQETQGLSILEKFLSGANIGDLFGQSKAQISDTLAGKYANPLTSPFIKAMQTSSSQDLQDALNVIRRGAGARGKFFSTAALGEEKDLANRNLQNLNQIIGSFIQNERQNMLTAVPLANAMDQYELTTAPLAKVQASQTLGSLNRTIEQADLERMYQDFTRQRTEMAGPIAAAQNLYGTKSEYGIPSWQMPDTPNTLGQIMNTLGGLNWGSFSGTGSIWDKLGGLFKK